ncbi:MAG: hypothetical protein CVU63_13385, partial [Deltaproteobacteria bacterium HGW-Deltaproteobacteria-20]
GAPAVAPSRVLIVMFNKALSMFVREALPALGLQDAVLDTFHGWALKRIAGAYKGDVKIDVSDIPGKKQAVALKKNLGILHAVDAYVRLQRARIVGWLRSKLAPYKAEAWADRFDASTAPVARALVDMRVAARQSRDASTGFERQRLEQIVSVFERAADRVRQYKEELLAILTDTALLQRNLPEVAPEDIQALVAYQQALQSKEACARRPGPFVAFEDLAILLRLIQVKNGGLPAMRDTDPVELYDHLVIDEAQDFGAVELKVLLATAKSRTGVTIAGDINQKIVPEADFIGWDAIAAELGISERIRWLGERGGVSGLLAAMNVFALSSHSEGLPLVILEAMATGLPVVATAVGGVSSVVDEGETGFLVGAGDESAMRERMQRLLSDRELSSALGRRGRARVHADFSSDRVGREYLRLYREAGLASRGLLRRRQPRWAEASASTSSG